MGKQGMVDEASLCLRRCTHASVRRMGLQILCPRHCLGLAQLLAESGGILIERWASVAADNLRSYVRDSDPKQYWTKAVE
jgi:hypothetical protein